MIDLLNTSSFEFGVIVGLGIVIFDYVISKDMPSSLTGITFIIFGVFLYVASLIACNYYNISLQELDDNRRYFRYIRRLPYFSIAILSSGFFIMFFNGIMRLIKIMRQSQ